MSIKCLIIDDEPLAINVIKNYLNDINDVVIVETFSNAIDGINFLKDNHVDLILELSFKEREPWDSSIESSLIESSSFWQNHL